MRRRKRILFGKILVVLVVAVAVVSQHQHDEDAFLDVAFECCGAICLAGAAIGRLWVAAFISGSKQQRLVTDGPYSISRNPLYFFSFFGFLGTGLAFESFTLTGVMVLIFFFTHWPAILREEEKLRFLFGAQFEEYARYVPRFFPRPWRFHNPDEITLSPSVFSKAFLDCCLIGLVFSLTHLIEWAHLHSILPTLFYLP